MDRDEEYRRQAADAQALADRAKNTRDRAAWLRIAQSWLDLIGRKQTLADAFNDETETKGTGQEPSSSTH